MLKAIITIIFIYLLIRLLTRLIFLVLGVFLSRTLKRKHQNAAKNGFTSRKEQNDEHIIDAEFKEVKR